MRARTVGLVKRCPACGGRAYAEAKLPLNSSLQPLDFNLDDIAGLVERQSLGLLLALIELLPYKNFECTACRYEFRLENRTAKTMVRAMLDGLQPVAPDAPAPRRRSTPLPVTPDHPDRPAAPTPAPRPRPAAPRIPAPSIPPPTPAPEWEPYHLESDMDTLFDQFKDG